jgi:hypothetical protein
MKTDEPVWHAGHRENGFGKKMKTKKMRTGSNTSNRKKEIIYETK